MKVLACVVLCSAWLAGSLAYAAEAPQLPVPTGPYGIGRIAYDWTDAKRADRLAADPQRPRELMVYLWYPTAKPAHDERGVYLPGAKHMDADAVVGPEMREGYGETWPQILSGAIYSHVVENAPAAKGPKQFPVVLLSHGSGGSGFGYTALIEAMVSRGYVVAAIEHTGIANVVFFPGGGPDHGPDGRLAPQHRDIEPAGLSQAQQFQRMMEQVTLGIQVGTEDVRFVLDRLTQLNAGDRKQFALAGRLDLNRVTAMGHSAGAEFAASACELDARFKACVDLDGGMAPVAALPEYPGKKVQQPLLFLEAYHDEAHIFGTHEQKLAFFQKEKEQLAECPAGSYRVVLNPPDMMHGSFSDSYVLHAGNTPEQTARALHNLELAESYILAFLDTHMKHAPAPLLDDATVPHPEATIEALGR